MERLLTTEDVAEYLRVDVVTVRRLVTRGELTAYRIAGEYRFMRDDLESFVRSQRVTARDATMLFGKFTERARKVLSLARQEAGRYYHDAIGTEHLLLGIVSEGEGVGAKVLHSLDIPTDKIRSEVEIQHPAKEEHVQPEELALTPRAKKSIELAVDEARLLGHHYLGTEHLLLGLLREKDGLAGQVLTSLGVTLENARAQTKQILATQQDPEDSQQEASD